MGGAAPGSRGLGTWTRAGPVGRAKVPATACSGPSSAGPDQASFAKLAPAAATHVAHRPHGPPGSGAAQRGAAAAILTQAESSHATHSTWCRTPLTQSSERRKLVYNDRKQVEGRVCVGGRMAATRMETSGGAEAVILNNKVIWAVATVCWVQTDTERTHRPRALLPRGISAKRLPETPLRCPAHIRSAPAGGGSGAEAGQAGILPLKPPDRAGCPALLRKNQR